MVQYLPNTSKTLGLIPSTKKKKKEGEDKQPSQQLYDCAHRKYHNHRNIIETESRKLIAKGCKKEELVCSGYRDTVLKNERVLELCCTTM